jgi:hypothetical protein
MAALVLVLVHASVFEACWAKSFDFSKYGRRIIKVYEPKGNIGVIIKIAGAFL